MSFSNILVGIDLARCNPLDMSGLNPIAREPIHWGIKLAKAFSSRLTFFCATNISEEALLPLSEKDRAKVHDSVLMGCSTVLDEVVRHAKSQGVTAGSKLVHGKGWQEIIRQVNQEHFDLVVVGTRNLTGIRRMLFGNTAMKLVRRCPCPVLVTKVGTHFAPINMLIAASLKPAAEENLRLGIALAHQTNGRVHILHVVEHLLDRVCSVGLPDDAQDEYRRKVRADAEGQLYAMLAATDYKSLGERVEVHLAEGVGTPDVAIQHFIQVNDIHLLVMGTIARTGIPGILIGNTAERLLPEVHCSVLAIKPPGFVDEGSAG